MRNPDADHHHRITSTADVSRTPLLLPHHIVPPRWPLVAGAVAAVAMVAGGMAAQVRAPVGNLVALSVVSAPGVAGPRADDVRHALEAELVEQLRALRLDVGGPDDGRTPATRIHVELRSAAADGDHAVRASAMVHVAVADEDDAGGTEGASGAGWGADARLAAQDAGQRLAWKVVEDVATLVAPGLHQGSVLRRVTDGRTTLRVFARLAAQLRDGHGPALHEIRALHAISARPARALTDAEEHVRLLDELPDGSLLLARTPRRPLLLPSSRQQPRVMEEADQVVLRDLHGAERVLHRAWRVVGATVQEDTLHVQQDDGGGVVAVHTVPLDAPVPRAPLVAAVTGDPDPSRPAWPQDATFTATLADGTQVALAPAGTRPVRQRLLVRAPGDWVFHQLAQFAGMDRNARLSRDGTRLYFESVVEDPFADAAWSRVMVLGPTPEALATLH